MAVVYLDEATAPAGTNVNISSGLPSNATAQGTSVFVTAGDGGATSGNAGVLEIRAGNAPTNGLGGEMLLQAGNAAGAHGGGQNQLVAGNAGTAGAGGDAGIYAGNGGSVSGNGGGVNLQAGNADGAGYGGDISLTAGSAVGNASQQGGTITLDAGSADDNGNGGEVNISGGRGGFTNGTGGTVSLIAGSADGGGDGGQALITSGDGEGNFNGGNIELTGGQGGATGNGAPIFLTAGAGGATSGNGGNITLTPGTKTSGVLGHVKIATLENYTTDAAALAGGVPVTGLYRNGNEVRVNSAAANEGGSIDVVIDGAGAVITTGLKGYLTPAPFAMTLTQNTLIANAAGSIVVNIWKCTYAQFDAGATHPVVGDKITASAPPTITAATKSQDSTLTGWTIAIAAGDILAFNVDSVATIQQVGLSLKYTKA